MSTTSEHVNTQLDDRRVAREFIKAYGSQNQYERWMAGLLPDAEVTALVRHHLFAPFVPFRRWRKIEANDIRHERDCTGGDVEFFTQKPGSLTHDEWSAFKKITLEVSQANSETLAANGVQATVDLVEHVGRCSTCKAERSGRAANIRIVWAGRPLSREYDLEAR